MKKISLIIALMLCLSLVGCSSNSGPAEVSWDNGAIKVDGTTVTFDDFYGYGATYFTGQTNYIYGQTVVDDLSFADFNDAGVLKGDMTKFKKALYFEQFLGSEMTMYYPIDEKAGVYSFCHAVCPETTESVVAMASNAYDVISKCSFSGIKSVTVNGTVTLTAPDFEIHVRPDAVVIPGYLKISAETKSECTEPVTVGKKTLYYYNSGNYEYYQYGDLLIQVSIGAPITDYITFK